jgi:DNA topoisomerase IB
MTKNTAIFDARRTREIIEKGKRARWWKRRGLKTRGFHYVDADGTKITDEKHLERIKSLVIPPAWKHVRISPFAASSLQAVGMDHDRTHSYLYHSKFPKNNNRKNSPKSKKFGEYLPKLRRTTNEHLSLEGSPREKGFSRDAATDKLAVYSYRHGKIGQALKNLRHNNLAKPPSANRQKRRAGFRFRRQASHQTP